MARKPRWVNKRAEKGVFEIKLHSWKFFSDYISQELLNYTTYVFRGHGNANWKLEPTLDRVLKSPKSSKRVELLETFKFAARGRRGRNPAVIESENDWWALGQHHGLSTPLLDWTESPFVALYFAAATAYREKSTNFAIFALSQYSINSINELINNDDEVELINDHKPTVKIVRPLSNENSRLVSQRGLFTRGPNNLDIESWVKKYNYGRERSADLMKITIPTSGVQDCLRYLIRMNLNHSTLFPDLMGASIYCNNTVLINKY